MNQVGIFLHIKCVFSFNEKIVERFIICCM